MPKRPGAEEQNDRWRRLHAVEDRLDLPLAVLGFVWLAILILELTRGIGPVLQWINIAIWIIFIAEFMLRMVLAPEKGAYLRRNWLTAIALVIPALRIARFARAVRAVRGIRLVRLVSSLNRGMQALGRSIGRRGAGYVAALTVIVILGGAAGMLAFEAGPAGLQSYGDALWFTAMLVTTMGSGYWPRSPEGRILTLLLSLYALGILGYVTAVLASFFVERDTEADQVAASDQMRALSAEIASLRDDLRSSRSSRSSRGEPRGIRENGPSGDS